MWNMTILSNISTAELNLTHKTINGLADLYVDTTGREIAPYVLRNIYYGRRKDEWIKVSKVTDSNLTITQVKQP